MAAIAKLISYDGGIAFSDSVVKFQKREGDSKLIPLSEIASLGIRRPREDTDGFLRLLTSSGQKYWLYFDASQYREAVQFKRQFDALLAERNGGEPSAKAPSPAPVPAPRRPAPAPEDAAKARLSQQRIMEKSPKKRRTAPPADPGGRQRTAQAEAPAKKPLFRRWWFWVLIALVVLCVVFYFVGSALRGDTEMEDMPQISEPAGETAGSQAGTEETALAGQEEQTPAESAERPASQPEGAGTLGNYDVQIKDAVKAVDYDGNPAIVITFAWTNNSDATTNSLMALVPKAFQDGVQLADAVLTDTDGYDGSTAMTQIRPGTTLDVQCAYILESASPVEFELSELFGFGGTVMKTFDPTAL